MRSRFAPSLALLFLSVFLSVPVAAQLPWGDGYQDHCLLYAPDNTIAWPPALGAPPSFGRMVIADLDGDLEPEGAVVANGALVVLWDIQHHDAAHAVTFPTAYPPVDVRDIAALPRGTTDDPDAILMTDERGLLRIEYDLENQAFSDPTVIGDSDWADAARIHVDDLDGDGDLDVIGVGMGKHHILRLTWNGSAFVAESPLYYSFEILDVAGVNWDGDAAGTREPVALTRRGVAVFFPGVPPVTSVHLALTGCIARLRFEVPEGEPPLERLAWTRPFGSQGQHELLVLGADGIDGPWPLTFDLCSQTPSIQPTAIVAGTYDMNGDDDLLLVHEGSRTAIVLQNLAGADTFNLNDTKCYDVVKLSNSLPGPVNVGIPAFTQVDGRPADDIVVALGGTAKVEVFLKLPFVRALDSGFNPSSADIVHDQSEFAPAVDPEHGTLRLALHVPEPYEGYTFVDLVVWERDDFGSGWVNQQAIYHKRHALLPIDPETHEPDEQWIEVPSVFPAGSIWTSSRPGFYTEFRFSRVVGGNTERSKMFMGVLTLRDCDTDPPTNCSPNYDNLIEQGTGPWFVLDEGFDLDGPPPGSNPNLTARTSVGAYVPMSSNPPFQVGVQPVRGARGTGSPARPFYIH